MKEAKKPILITGCSSGIGKKTVELLSSKGHLIYATARKQEDLDKLKEYPNTLPLRLDVTKPEQIKEAMQIIKQEGKGLYGLVNNAGIVNIGPIFTHTVRMIHDLFDINVYGLQRMTNAVLPFMFKNGGRIVNISSISGILTGSFFGLYSMSKHAVEAYSDALMRDFQDTNIKISVIEPGNFHSDIGKKFLERRLKEKRDERLFMSEEQHKLQIEEIKKGFIEGAKSPEPKKVAEAIYDALFSDNPKPRYLVTGNQEEAEWVIRRMFRELTQMNHKHEHSYNRNQLVEMLDEALFSLKDDD